MTLNEENGRPRKTDRTEASDESAFEEQNSRRSSCAEQIVQANSAGEIARVAASLMRDGRDEIEATRTALRLFELAHFALSDLRDRGDIESGVARCKESWADHEAIRAAEASIPAYTYKTDQNGNRLPVPFDEGLRVLMPRLKPDDRIKNFRAWIASQYEPQRFAIKAQQLRSLLPCGEDLEQESNLPKHLRDLLSDVQELESLAQQQKDPQELLIIAGRQIDEMRENGIPANVFERLQYEFRDWRTKNLSEVRSISGKKGVASKTDKVSEASKPKQKRSARPPKKEMREILNKVISGDLT